MEWKRQDPDSPTAVEITEDYAAPKGDKIRTLVVADTDYAIVTWKNRRRIWQYFYRDPDNEDRWKLILEADSATAAKKLAEDKRAENALLTRAVQEVPDGELVITAEWKPPYTGSRPLTVPCSSGETGKIINAILRRLGMVTSIKSVDSQKTPA